MYIYWYVIRNDFFSEYVTIERISDLCFSLLDLDLYRYGKWNFELTTRINQGIILLFASICILFFQLFDNSPYAWPNEFIRSAVFLILYVKFGTWNEFKIPYPILVATFSVSMIIATISMTARLFVRGGAKDVKIN